MGICSICIYKGDKVVDNRRNPHLRKEDFNCLNVKNSIIDYVTGTSKLGTCRMCNGIGECLFFDDGSIPLYAWSDLDKIVYTLHKNVDITDSYRDEKTEVIGQISDCGETTFFAYKSKEKNYYTLSEEVEVGDKVFLEDRTEIGEVSEIEEDSVKISVDEITFAVTRNKKADIKYEFIIANDEKLFRTEWEDTYFIPEEAEEPTTPEPTDPEPDITDPTDPIDPDGPDIP